MALQRNRKLEKCSVVEVRTLLKNPRDLNDTDAQFLHTHTYIVSLLVKLLMISHYFLEYIVKFRQIPVPVKKLNIMTTFFFHVLLKQYFSFSPHNDLA
jgi:hypothetical protein